MMKHSIADEETAERAALYALSALDEQESLAFEQHLSEGCDVCRDELRSYDVVTASLGSGLPEATPAPSVRRQLVEFLSSETQAQEQVVDDPHASAFQMLAVRADEGEWREIAPGVFQKPLFEDRQRDTSTYLIKMGPGAHVSRHRHLGLEECLIIEGDFHANGELYQAGDYLCAPAGSIHENLHTVHGALLMIVSNAGYQVLE
jgi:anti-sigma factor ChrR (cupin superfamily)